MFKRLDVQGSGEVSEEGLKKIMNNLQLSEQTQERILAKMDPFDH